jgi:hypothetical protein
MSTEGFAATYRPSLATRIWRRLGFRYHLGAEDPRDEKAVDKAAGWMRNETYFNFNLTDRLRLLISGRFKVILTQHIDVPSPDKVVTRVDWMIYHPGERR